MINRFLFVVSVLAGHVLTAQSNSTAAANAPVVREYSDLVLLGTLRGELIVSDKLRGHIEGAYNRQKDYRLFNEQYKFYSQAGIDFNMGGRWYIGGSVRFSSNYFSQNTLLSRGHVGHYGKVGSLFLYKELSGELFTYGRTGTFKPPSQARLGLGGSIGKVWSESALPFYVQLSGKLFFNRYFDDLYQTIYQQRFIDQTRLRLEAGVRPVDWCWITAFGMMDTSFYYRLGLYDASGSLISSDARVNDGFPIVGLQATFVIHSDRQEEYHPGLPLR